MPVQMLSMGVNGVLVAVEDGALVVKVINPSGGSGTIPTGITPAEAFANPTTALPVGSFNMLYNGATWDRQLEAPSADAQARTGLAAAAQALYNGATYDRRRGAPAADAQAATGLAAAALMVFNGATWDRIKAAVANGGTITPVTGVQAHIPYMYDNGASVWQPMTGARSVNDANTLGVGQVVAPWIYNGTNFDRTRNNHEVTISASAARTASANSADQTNYNARAVTVVIDITVIAVATTLTVTIKGKDTLSGKYYTLLTTTALALVGTTAIQVGIGLPDTANVSANKVLPRIWRVEITNSDGNSITYSIGANYVN